MRVATIKRIFIDRRYEISTLATRAGGDLTHKRVASVRAAFQPSPPVRVATVESNFNTYIIKISTLATRAGGDQSTQSYPRTSVYFNPRHPCGWRPEALSSVAVASLFQPSPPVRVATNYASRLSAVFQNFNPRHPCGWRPCTACFGITRSYFNPRHPCGWRLHGSL